MCTVAVGVSLYFVYALSVVLFLQHLDLSSVSLLELVIVAIQVIKLAGVVGFYGAKPARVEVLLVLISFETFVVTGLIALYTVSPSPLFSGLADTIFSTWIGTLLVVLPSYLIFAAVIQMTRDRSLIAVLLSITLAFGFLSFAMSTMLAFAGTFTFANFFDFLIGVAKSDLAAGTLPPLSILYLLIPSVAMYCALLVFTTVPTSKSVVPPKVTFVLPLLGAVVALGWVGAGVPTPNSLLSFTAPGIIVVALLWAYMRR